MEESTEQSIAEQLEKLLREIELHKVQLTCEELNILQDIEQQRAPQPG